MHCVCAHVTNIIYVYIGQEFQAVFFSTIEPIDKDGNTLNPTKSPCDRYIFNTFLTKAKSLVVVVGSPLVLLKTETHMVKLYGDKGRCWSLYLKSCLENGTLIIPSMVEPDPVNSEQFKEDLAHHVGATLPQQVWHSGHNYKTVDVHSSIPAHPPSKAKTESRHAYIAGGVTNDLTKHLDPVDKLHLYCAQKGTPSHHLIKNNPLPSTLYSESDLTHEQSGKSNPKLKTTGIIYMFNVYLWI